MAFTARPATYDDEILIGDTLTREAELLDEDGDAYDVSGATGTCQIRTEPGGTLLASPTVTLPNSGTDGLVRWTLAAASTSALTAQTARWALRLTLSDSTVHTILEGVMRIRQGVVA